jgi:hypothetical protein
LIRISSRVAAFAALAINTLAINTFAIDAHPLRKISIHRKPASTPAVLLAFIKPTSPACFLANFA